MGQLDSRKTYNNLKKKGFVDSLNKGKDHKRLEFWYDGKLTRCNTMLSHNGQDLSDFHISMMARQIYLDKKQFIKFSECTLSHDDYIEILKLKNLI